MPDANYGHPAVTATGSRFPYIRRIWLHLTRRRARAAIALAVISTLMYALVPDLGFPDSVADPIRQFLLILASVAAGAVFLPELSSDLWSITKEDARKLIPQERRRALARALIGAESQDAEWDDLVMGQAIEPLVQAGRDPSLIVKNLNYSVRVHLNQKMTVDGRDSFLHVVETTSNSERVLPPAGTRGSFWVSVARTDAALSSEYYQRCCLARELVQLGGSGGTLSGESWRRSVEQLCQVAVTINGQVQQISIESDPEVTPDLVRFVFRPEGEETASRVPVQIAFDFPMSRTEDRFPAIFSGFYCGGATVVSLRVYGLPTGAGLTCDPFFSRPLGASRHPGFLIRGGAEGQSDQATFSTGRDSILWPGSGVLFDWHKCASD